MLKIIVDFHSLAERVVSKGAPIFKITQLPIVQEILRMKTAVPNDKVKRWMIWSSGCVSILKSWRQV